jgi:acyl homoserine lactone synthase
MEEVMKLRFLDSAHLREHPELARSMFRDRAIQFHDRLGWDVHVSSDGLEKDEYDLLDPHYVIALGSDGLHSASIRFLPTTGRTMVQDHFAHLMEGISLYGSAVWEATRLCSSPTSRRSDVARLFIGAALFGKQLNLAFAVGIFEARMLRVYRALGWSPYMLGAHEPGPTEIRAGVWSFSRETLSDLQSRLKISKYTFEGSHDEAEITLS